MKTRRSIVAVATVAALWAGLGSMPSIGGESEELFFAYACGRTLCTRSVEPVSQSGFTRTRFIKTDRYVNEASITFTVADGKRVITMDSLTMPVSGVNFKRHYVYTVADDGPATTWFSTGTEGEYDFFVIKGREALANAPYPLEPVERPTSTFIATGDGAK